jgi:hypothetical protein
MSTLLIDKIGTFVKISRAVCGFKLILALKKSPNYKMSMIFRASGQTPR